MGEAASSCTKAADALEAAAQYMRQAAVDLEKPQEALETQCAQTTFKRLTDAILGGRVKDGPARRPAAKRRKA